jgi:hypothetical protein
VFEALALLVKPNILHTAYESKRQTRLQDFAEYIRNFAQAPEPADLSGNINFECLERVANAGSLEGWVV